MKLELDGVVNVRDVGGIVTPLGTIKRNKLLRSAELSRLTPHGERQLLALNVTRVVDLRTDGEKSNCPDIVPQGVEYLEVPIINSTTFGITYEKSDGAEIAEKLLRGIERMQARGESATEHLAILYRKFVNDEFSRNGYGTFLKTLAKPTDGATIWHCSVGKDRCGTCAALLLYCLGASKEQIFDDYMLTNEQTAEHQKMILDKVRSYVSQEHLDLISILRSVTVEYLQDFFNEIHAKFGSTENFLAVCGVTDEDVAQLRQNYLE